jgi:ribonucleoside-diphosphate reductase alpha chain
MFIMMGLKYDSKDAIDCIDHIMKVFKEASVMASIDLAEDRGECEILTKYRGTQEFENFVNHEYFSFLKTDYPEYFEKLKKTGIRNISLSTVAPNGSLALLLGRSSGLEPIFRLSYSRGKINAAGVREEFIVYHNLVKEYDEIYGEGAHKNNSNFITSDKIDWKMRVHLQAAIQKYITSSISSTVNLPNNIPMETVSDIYFEAWRAGLKGVTIYRDGSREGVLNEVKEEKKERMEKIEQEKTELEKFFEEANGHVISDLPVKLPTEYFSKGYILRDNTRKKWYVTLGFADRNYKKPFAIFVNTNSNESTEVADETVRQMKALAEEKGIRQDLIDEHIDKIENQSNIKKVARSIGFLLRHNVKSADIVTVLDAGNYPLSSIVFHLKRLLKEFIPDGTVSKVKCPDCGENLVFEAGCAVCYSCGHAKCS